MTEKLLAISVLVLSAGMIIVFGGWVANHLAPESAPAARGAAYAGVQRCIDCHGDPDNLLLDANDQACSDVNSASWHPDYSVNCGDVLSYFEVIRLQRNFESRIEDGENNLLIAGEALAREYHCFQCHGPLGQGGFANAKSLKGYVPGYFGDDFRALTKNGDPNSVALWIRHGRDSAIVDNLFTGKIAEYFFEREAVSMPSYQSLPPDQIKTLTEYVLALNEFGPMTAEIVRSYGAATVSRAEEK